MAGSPQYWITERKRMKAMSDHLEVRSRGKEQFNIFQTFSPADFHWDSFHRLLPGAAEQYLNKTVCKKYQSKKLLVKRKIINSLK